MENTVHEVESQGVQSYILDLRNNPVEFQTASGQMIDLITTIEREKDLSKYSLPLHRRIVQYKTAYYSFYLPVACALLMAGEDLDNHVTVQNVLIDMGIYFQVQDDYLDCFGEPEKIGKVNMDLKLYQHLNFWYYKKDIASCQESASIVLHIAYLQRCCYGATSYFPRQCRRSLGCNSDICDIDASVWWAMAPVVLCTCWLCFPVAYLISKLLDSLLGNGHGSLF
ncbi:hypothetical protein ACP275_06G162200 [Erythranthe tilingii]